MCTRLLTLSGTKLSPDTSLLTDATSQTKFVAVVGPARTGKSYLLNYLAGKPGVFPVGNAGVVTSNVDIMNGAVQLGQHRVRLIDVEGIGDNSENHDYRLCVPVMAASDAVLLNIQGKLGKTALLTLLGRFIFMHNKIRNDQTDCELNKENKTSLFPTLILVMRDWQGTLSGEKYLIDLLQAEPEDNADQKERNRLRKSIVVCFTSIRIVTMPQPADVSALNDKQIPFDRTTEEFRAQAKALSNIVQGALSRPITTLFGNKLGTEVSMAAILATLATEVSKPHFSVPSTMQALHESAMREIDRMLDSFMQKAEPLPKLPCESEQLKNLLNKRYEVISKKYAQLTANLAKDEAHKIRFLQVVKKSHDDCTASNDRKLARICQSAFDKVEMALRSAQDANILAWDGLGKTKLEEETLRMLAAEGVLLRGNALPDCWLEYCKRIQRLEADTVGNYRRMQQLKQQQEEANRQAAEKLKQMEREKDEQRKKIEEERKRMEREKEEQRKKIEEERKRMERDKEEQRKKIEEERKRMEREKEEQQKRTEREMEEQRKKTERMEREMEEERRRTQREREEQRRMECAREEERLERFEDRLRTFNQFDRPRPFPCRGPFEAPFDSGFGGSSSMSMSSLGPDPWVGYSEKFEDPFVDRYRKTPREHCESRSSSSSSMSSHGSVSSGSSASRSTSRYSRRSKSCPRPNKSVGYSARGHKLFRGPRGGVYHISRGGNKVYH